MIARKLEARKSAFAARKNECGFVGALKSEEGAIDLASIMVGVIVIGVIAGVIAATVFAVIPWSQDKAAAQSLDAVNQAESVAFAQSTDAGAGVYLDGFNIVKHDGTVPATTPAVTTVGVAALLQDSKSVEIKSGGSGYIAVSKSATGKFFATTNLNPNTAVKYADLTALNAAFPALTPVLTTPSDANDAIFVTADFQ